MNESDYLLNIQEQLEKHRDIQSARMLLRRAHRELNNDQFRDVVYSIHHWLLQNRSYHDLAEHIYQLLAEYHPSGDSYRRLRFAEALKEKQAEDIRLEREKRETDERDRNRRQIRERNKRIEEIKRQKEEMERQREREKRENDERDKRQVRERNKHLEATARQKEGMERQQLRENQRLLDEKRDALIKELRKRLQSDFMGAENFFRESCVGVISPQEFEDERLAFVKSWVNANTRSSTNDKKPTPDHEQVAAIASLHGHVQVVARAGSGKTTTLVNRTLFLLKHCGVSPSEILLLAFNRKAALEIRRRLLALLNDGADAAVVADIERRRRNARGQKKTDVYEIEAEAVNATAARLGIVLPHVMTFHALAYAIVHPEESLLYNGAEGEPQEKSQALQKVIKDYLQVPVFKAQIRQLMLAHFREDWEHIVAGRYDQSKEELLQFRRSLPRESIDGEYVKSYGEKIIANFLFEHDISYKYERNHWWKGINYRPDFTIFKKSEQSGVIVEYFGLKGDADYDEMSNDKRAYWDAKQDWELIEFSPADIASRGCDTFLGVLKKRLEEQGIPCIKLSEDEIWNRINDEDRVILRFTESVVGFISRCRKLSLSPSELQTRIESYLPISPVESMFHNLAQQLYAAYLDKLVATGEEDFDGLMQRAAEAINSGQTAFQRKSGTGNLVSLRYICIDEFQDFSDLFYRLFSAIRNNNPKVELFCVGDDWQAINGFAGSDLRFFENFKDYIGESRRLYISRNYRSSKSIVAVGNAVMASMGKPAVADKKSAGKVLVSNLNDFEPSLIEKERYKGDNITPAVLRLVNRGLADGVDIVMLNRTNRLNWYVSQFGSKSLDGFLESVRLSFPKDQRERITISTTHKYKGLEKPMVIVLDAVARSYPLIHPDWVFVRIFGESPEKIATEDRRLFYVALTRAVDTLVILTDGRSKSPFLEELELRQPLSRIDWLDYPPVQGHTARLVVRVGNQKGRGSTPTIAIKDLLKATGYQWRSTGGSSGWEKSFPADGFNLNLLKAELWAGQADGIDICIIDGKESLTAHFLVNQGNWISLVDRLETIHAPKREQV